MGVFPLAPRSDAGQQRRAEVADVPDRRRADTPFETLSPPVKVFDTVRARPEAPVVIINHPRGGVNYFAYVGYDPATGTATSTADWDTKFTLVEVFNNSRGRATATAASTTGSACSRRAARCSPSAPPTRHGIVGSPVGYPRTCIELGTDDPRQLTREPRARSARGRPRHGLGRHLRHREARHRRPRRHHDRRRLAAAGRCHRPGARPGSTSRASTSSSTARRWTRSR